VPLVKEGELQKEKRLAFLQRFKAHQYTLPILAWEAGLARSHLAKILKGVPTASATVNKLIEVSDIYDDDIIKLIVGSVDELMMEPIRIFHFGKNIEEALLEADITHVFSLVSKTPYEIVKLTSLGETLASKLSANFGPNLKFGMAFSEHKCVNTKVIVEMKGFVPDICVAMSSINRNLIRLDNDEISLRTSSELSSPIHDGQKGSLNNHPFRMSLAVQCGTTKLELVNKRYRGCKSLASKLREIADSIDGIETPKQWAASNVWVTDHSSKH